MENKEGFCVTIQTVRREHREKGIIPAKQTVIRTTTRRTDGHKYIESRINGEKKAGTEGQSTRRKQAQKDSRPEESRNRRTVGQEETNTLKV